MQTITPITYEEKFQEELPTVRQAQQDCPHSIAKLVSMTLPLRRAMAFRHLPASPSLHEDAIQVGWLGALKALPKWNPARGVRFVDWSRFDISWAIRDFKYKMEKAVSRPHWIYRKLNQLNAYETDDLDELSNLLACPAHKLEAIQNIRSSDMSLSPGLGSSHESPLISEHLVNRSTPCDEFSKNELIAIILKRAESLSDRERRVIDARYGLTNGSPQAHREIGEKLGLTRQRVEQIESEAIRKIRQHFKSLDSGWEQEHKPKPSRHTRKRRNFCRRRDTSVQVRL